MSDSQNPFSGVQFGNFQGVNLDVTTGGLSEADLAAQKAQTQLLLNMQGAATAPMGDAMSLSPEAMQQLAQQRGLQGTTKEAPKGFLAKLWKRFNDISGWVYLPSMAGIALGFLGLGGNVMEKNAAGQKVATDVLKRTKANWFAKPFHGLVDACHWFTEKLVPWGNRISSFVLDTCGVGKLLGRGRAHGGIWNGLKRLAEFGPGWKTLQEGRWYSGIATFFKGAGSFCGTGTAATSIAQTGLRFSLRSVLTAFGFAGPLGWLAGGIAAAWTAVSLIRSAAKWFSSSEPQHLPATNPSQQFVSPSTALGSYGSGPQFSAFGNQLPLA